MMIQEVPALEGEFAGFSARDLLTQNVDELRRTVAERRERREAEQKTGARQSDVPIEIPQECVQMLEGHGAEVFICAWSPTAQQLATGCAPQSPWLCILMAHT